MRKIVDGHSPLGSVDIGAVKLDMKSRDEMPALLGGLQAIWRNEALRAELFRLLDEHILPGKRRDTGRPGMHLWRILVMGVLKQGLGCDYDRLQWIVNHDSAVRAFLAMTRGTIPAITSFRTSGTMWNC